MLATCRDLPCSATDQPMGAAACFNRLAQYNDAALVIFLEAGALVGPHWLQRLTTALGADPTHGLAGPQQVETTIVEPIHGTPGWVAGERELLVAVEGHDRRKVQPTSEPRLHGV